MSETASTNIALDRWAVVKENEKLQIVVRPNNKMQYTITSEYTLEDLGKLIEFLQRESV